MTPAAVGVLVVVAFGLGVVFGAAAMLIAEYPARSINADYDEENT